MISTTLKINRINILSVGDEYFGIPPMSWTIEQELYIDKENIYLFQNKLQEAWEYIADDIIVTFEFDGMPLQCPLKNNKS